MAEFLFTALAWMPGIIQEFLHFKGFLSHYKSASWIILSIVIIQMGRARKSLHEYSE